MTAGSEKVLSALDLEPTAGGFRAGNMDAGGGVIFGGQILAQMVGAASRTEPEKTVKSLHTVFARSGRSDEPLDLIVETMQAGRSFASVMISAIQGETLCARSLVLLHAPDPDLIRHSAESPSAPDPEYLPPRGPTDWWDIRYDPAIDINDPAAVGPASLNVWTRFPGAPSDPCTGQALLAYASDGFLIATAMRPHKGIGQSLAHVSVSTTVLTQTITFHEPIDASQWMMIAHESPYAGRGRSYGRANVFDTAGGMIASFVQDNMIRDFPPGRAPAAGGRSAH